MKWNYNAIYQKHFSNALNEVKYLRDMWNSTATIKPKIMFAELQDEDSQTYQFVMQETKRITLNSLILIIYELIQHHDPRSCIFSIYEDEHGRFHIGKQGSHKHYTVAITSFRNQRAMFIFKEYGIANRVPEECIRYLMHKNNLLAYYYVSLVDDNAFSEVKNHNENVSDPSRGTNIYSLQWFFDNLFDSSVYSAFKESYLNYCTSVKEYYGLSVLKTLRPNVLYQYKQHICNSIISFNYDAAISRFSDRTLSSEQKAIIDQQFIKMGFYSALTSMLPFSKCFITAEWLFSSLYESADSIDLTVISMGYFKAIEQFLYSFVGQHTSGKDGKRREYAFKDDVWLELTDEQYCARKKEITLGGLAKYLKNHRNRDLLNPLLNQDTYDLIRDVLSKIAAQRNGYFHKDNIEQKCEIIKARDLAYSLFYLVLGAFSYSEADKSTLGICEARKPSEADRVCLYIHQLSTIRKDSFSIPIIYFSADVSKEDFWIPCSDHKMLYDQFGHPQCYGIRFKRLNESDGNASYLSISDLPQVIFEGALSISKQVPVSFSLTGAETQIWGNNTFLKDR